VLVQSNSIIQARKIGNKTHLVAFNPELEEADPLGLEERGVSLRVGLRAQVHDGSEAEPPEEAEAGGVGEARAVDPRVRHPEVGRRRPQPRRPLLLLADRLQDHAASWPGPVRPANPGADSVAAREIGGTGGAKGVG